MKSKKFSLRERAKSFAYAGNGIVKVLQSEHNARIHLLATVGVLILSLWIGVSHFEALALLLTTGMVWVAEWLNTAIEKLADIVSEERKPSIAFVKDAAAGAVLLAAITAVITACLVFIPKIF